MGSESYDFQSARSPYDLTQLVQVALRASGVLITHITPNSQIILANSGLQLPAEFARSMPLDYSICQHTVAMDFPLVIDQTSRHSWLTSNKAIPEFGIGAYLGAPIHVQEHKAMGAICALEFHERRWSSEDIRIIMAAARAADRLIVRPV